MAVEEIRGRITGDASSFKRATKQAGASTDKLKSKMGGLKTAMAGAFSIGAVTAFAKKSIDAYREQQNAVRKLSATFDGSTQALMDFAAKRQEVTTFGDELTATAMATAARFTESEKALKNMTVAAQDLAANTGMDLVKTMEYISSSAATGRNRLSRYGVDVELTGDKAANLAKILKEVNKQVGGVSEAMADTDAGQYKQHMNDLGDTMEEIGKVIIPAVNKALGFLQEQLEAVSYVSTKLGRLFSFNTWRVDAIEEAQTAIDNFKDSTVATEAAIEGLDNARSAAQVKVNTLSGTEKKAAKIKMEMYKAAKKQLQIEKELNKERGKGKEEEEEGKEEERSGGGSSSGVPAPQFADLYRDEWMKTQEISIEMAQTLDEKLREKALVQYEKKKELEKKQTYMEIEEARKRAREKVEQAQQSASRRAEAEKRAQRQALGYASQAIDTLVQMSEEGDKEIVALKVAAGLVQIGIDTAMGISNIWAQWGAYPPLAAGLTAAFTAVQVANTAMLLSQNLAEGGFVNGPSYGDNNTVNANGGEYMMTTKEQKEFIDAKNGGGEMNINVSVDGITTEDVSLQIAEGVKDGIQEAKYERMI